MKLCSNQGDSIENFEHSASRLSGRRHPASYRGITQAQQSSPSPTPAAGQAATPDSGQLQQVTVTGYLVPRIGDGPQPVVTLDQEFIKDQGDQTVADVLQRLPQNSNSFSPALNAGQSFSPAGSNVNLRGLGTNETLTLVDGHRVAPFPFPQNGTESFVDLNSYPLAAIATGLKF